jgi:DNA-binding beta-propeller fold protein YncE
VTSSCTVTFSAPINTYTVTPSGDGYETISPNTVQTVNYGSTQSFTVTASTYYTLNTVGGTCPAGSWNGSTYTTGPITGNCTVIFSAYLANYTVTPSGDGNETISPSGAQTVGSSGSQAFTVTANTNYTVNSSVGGTCPAGFWNGNIYVTGIITGSCTVIFSAANSFTVTPSGDGNESIYPNTPETVTYGNVQSFNVTATTGTLNTTVAGTCPTSGASWSGSTYTTGPITSSCSVIFSTNTSNVTITPSAGSNVSISPSTPQTVVYGANQSFTLTPTQGYTVSVGGTCPQSSWSASTYTVGPVTSNCTVTVSASPTAYVSNTASAGTSTILLCTGGGSGGAMTCNGTPIITGLTSPGRVAVNASNTFLYVPDSSTNKITYCPITSGGNIGTCQTSVPAINSLLNKPYDMAINAAGTFAYIANYGNSKVIYCQINPATGALASCSSTGSSFSGPSGVAFNPSNTYLYVSNYSNNNVTYCAMNSTTGVLSSCSTTGGLTNPPGITINNSDTYAYLPDPNGYMYTCSISSNTLTNCNYYGGYSFHSSPATTALFTLSGTPALYVANTGTNKILYCPLSSGITPSGGSCTTALSTGSAYYTGITFGYPTAVGLVGITPIGDGNETISPSTTQNILSGGTQSFTVTANSGYTLNTTVGGTCPTGTWSGSTYTTPVITSSCTVLFSADATGYYSVLPSGDSNETISPSTPQSVASGGTQAFNVTANSGYTLNTIVGGTCPTSGSSWVGSTYTTGAITSTCSVIFSADAPGYYSVIPSGDGYETITPSTPQAVTSGGTKSFNVTASTGHTLSNTVGGTCPTGSWSGSTYTTGSVTSSCTVTFSAPINTYTVTPGGDGYETISPSTAQTVNYGSTQSFTVTPNSGYTVSSTVGGTCPAGSWNGSTYTTGTITSNCTVNFAISIVSYTVTPSGDGNETISPSTAQTVSTTGSQAFTVTPNANYTVNSSVGGTCPAGFWNGNIYVTGIISGSCTVIFSATNSFTVTPSGDGNESIYPNTPETVTYGNVQSFNVTATTGTLNTTVAGTCPTSGASWSGSTYTTGPITSSCSVIFSTNTSNVTITPSAGSNVSISPSTPQTVVYGANQSFTLTPTQGYTVSVGGTCPQSSWSASTYTVGPVTSNCTVTVSASPTAYVSNTASAGTSTILLCTGGGSGGAMTCNGTPIITGLTSPGRVAVNASNTFLYVPDNGTNKITYCSITSGGNVGTCQVSSPALNSILNKPYDVAINPAGTFAYIANYGNSAVIYCEINPATGALASCSSTGSSFNGPSGIAFNPTGTYLYVSNSGASSATYCAVNSTTGVLSSCSTTGGTIYSPGSITINNSGTYAYMPDTGGYMYTCSISSNTLTNCNYYSGYSFHSSPATTALFTLSGTPALYVANSGNNKILYCPLSSGITPSSGSCTTALSTGSAYYTAIAMGYGN